MTRRYTLPADTLFVTREVASVLALLLEPGRRAFADRLARHPDVRQWLAELDAFVPQTALQAPQPAETVWLTTEQAAAMLGVSTRQMRNLAGKVRAEKRGREWWFDREEVEAEHDARVSAVQ